MEEDYDDEQNSSTEMTNLLDTPPPVTHLPAMISLHNEGNLSDPLGVNDFSNISNGFFFNRPPQIRYVSHAEYVALYKRFTEAVHAILDETVNALKRFNSTFITPISSQQLNAMHGESWSFIGMVCCLMRMGIARHFKEAALELTKGEGAAWCHGVALGIVHRFGRALVQRCVVRVAESIDDEPDEVIRTGWDRIDPFMDIIDPLIGANFGCMMVLNNFAVLIPNELMMVSDKRFGESIVDASHDTVLEYVPNHIWNKHRLAFAMVLHERLGEASPWRMLPTEVVPIIIDFCDIRILDYDPFE